MATHPTVYVVPLIDTEGPSKGVEGIATNWEEVRENLKILDTLRPEMIDPTGHPIILNWFLLDWVGYDSNEAVFARRSHAVGFHTVFDWYEQNYFIQDHATRTGDGVYFHYHHPPKDGSWGWNGNWSDSNWYNIVLSRKILDKHWFAGVFRAGGYVESNETSAWLENWFPFDYSNIAPMKNGHRDWSEATTGALPYHPSPENYQLPGSMKRAIMRGVPIKSRGLTCALQDTDITRAFLDAEQHGSSILAYGSHDYTLPMPREMKETHDRIQGLAKTFPHVSWKYANARDAAVQALDIPVSPIELRATQQGNDIVFNASGTLFSERPFVVAETETKELIWPKVEALNSHQWIVKDVQAFQRIGGAIVSPSADTAVCVLDLML